MKKRLLLITALMLASVAAFAQEGNEDKGPLYPKEGSIGVGISADPILDYIGNMFNGNTDNKTRTHWDKHGAAVYLRYFLFDDAAVRARFEFKGERESSKFHLKDDAALRVNPISTKEVEDLKVVSTNDYNFQVGYQMFRGAYKLKGFYGGDIVYGIQNVDTEYQYGNKMNTENPKPSTIDFDNTLNTINPGKRTLSEKGHITHTVGANIFTGVEYYFMPQACIGFEVGLLFAGQMRGKGTLVTEEIYGNTYNKIEKTTAEEVKTDLSFATHVARPHGTFYFVFHF